MAGLTQFAPAVVPGSLRVIASVGDERNALLMLAVEADFGAGKATLPGARLYLLDENNKIKTEQVIFYSPRSDQARGRGSAGPWQGRGSRSVTILDTGSSVLAVARMRRQSSRSGWRARACGLACCDYGRCSWFC